MALIKTPAYPFRFGLSPCRRLRVWISCLAAFAMKFSLALVLLFLLFAFSSDSDVGVATWLIGLGTLAGTFSVASYSDFKKSLLHFLFCICVFALFLLFALCVTDLDLALFAWRHHSLIASANFCIGLVYAYKVGFAPAAPVSGSRIVRFDRRRHKFSGIILSRGLSCQLSCLTFRGRWAVSLSFAR